jgi:hypothetical protein
MFRYLDEGAIDEKREHGLEHGSLEHEVMFMPCPGECTTSLLGSGARLNGLFPIEVTHTIFYRGHWLKVGPRSCYLCKREIFNRCTVITGNAHPPISRLRPIFGSENKVHSEAAQSCFSSDYK